MFSTAPVELSVCCSGAFGNSEEVWVGIVQIAFSLNEPQSRFRDKPTSQSVCVLCPQNGTAVLKGLTLFSAWQIHRNAVRACHRGKTDLEVHLRSYRGCRHSV